MINELREIRKLLEAQVSNQSAARSTAQPRNRTISVDITGAPFLGSKDAPIAIVQFTDFQCPYCNRFFREVLPDLRKNYINMGKIRFYSMDFPIKVHANALRAAEAGRCVTEQNRFWAMHDLMQGNPEHLEMLDLLDYANKLANGRECLS
ncbi:MAG TPA: thioredoxin domain-containing protein [Bryobacteraceae bacterium]|jgi:protein-disulfide isomerase|nr:thioredoxin domain-containing protein [Bryobacteraceae bacterium]